MEQKILNSKYLKDSLNISSYVYKNMVGKNTKSGKMRCHFNHHLVTCLKMIYPNHLNYVEMKLNSY